MLTKFPIHKDAPWQKACKDPQHSPGPMLLLIREGETYHWTCPSCGKVTVLRGSVQPSLECRRAAL